MKIYSWNVNGIRAVLKKGALQEFIKQEKPDILCMQETKAQEGQAVIDFEGYEEYWNSAQKPGYSGTAIFTRIKPLSVTKGFPETMAKKYDFVDSRTRDAANEGRVLTAEFDDFYLVTVYTPNSVDNLQRLPLRHKHWDPAFLAYVKELEKKKPVIFCGDLNVAHTEIDLANPKSNVNNHGFTPQERAGFDTVINAGFIDTFREFEKGGGHYTWWSVMTGARKRNIGWRLDYFLISASLRPRLKSAFIRKEIEGSDHCPVGIEIA